MKEYPEDWDAERIADDQAGSALFVIAILFVVVVVVLAYTGAIKP